MASITCRQGGEAHTHTSVAEVRACQLGDAAERHPVGTDHGDFVAVGGGENFATYYKTNQSTLPINRPRPNNTGQGYSATYDRQLRDSLRTLEKEVPAGGYAIGNGKEVRFYKIKKPTEGRWAGYTFIEIQASDDLFPVKNPVKRHEVLTAITGQGVQKSMERYGQELGKCGHCERTLTNDESRARGIGPICAGKMGW